MKLYIIDYMDFNGMNTYIMVAKNTGSALKKAQRRYRQDYDASDNFQAENVFELTEWEGYKICLKAIK
jgi:hypothetical protein